MDRVGATRKLYYEDSHIKEFDAMVIDCRPYKDGYGVVLDRTAFFPAGGGQDSDNGTISDFNVLDVYEENGVIYHYMKVPFKIRDGVGIHGKIDWNTRFRRMQNHSGEHVVSGIIHEMFGFENVGFHMGADEVIIDTSGVVEGEDLKKVQQRANEIIWKNVPVTTEFPKAEKLKNMKYRSKLELTENVRIVTIESCDCCACCAPHVSRTGEIGIIKLLSSERRREGSRIRMLCGIDALRDYQMKSENIDAISSMLSSKAENSAEYLERYIEDKECIKRQNTELKKLLAAQKAGQLEKTDGNICIFEEMFDEPQLRAIVNEGMKKCGGCCAAFSGNDKDGYMYVIGSEHQNMREAAKDINRALCGMGGGSESMIQGKIKASRKETELYFENKNPRLI